MKLVLLHGVGEVAKRQALSKLKASFTQSAVSIIDLAKSPLGLLQDALLKTSLFAEQNLVIVENAPANLNLDELKISDKIDLIVLAPQLNTNSALLKSASGKKAQILEFPGEKELTAFPYLDNLIEGKKAAFLELEKLLNQYGGVYVLSMIYYLLRRNLLPLPKAGFMQQKIKNQKLKIKDQDWERFYKLSLETELAIKTGKNEEKLALTRLTQEFLPK